MTTPAFDPQPCTDGNGNSVPCPEPQQFHRTTTATGPVNHPGRQYDITLPINPGFAVQSLQVDSVTSAANIVWEVDDPDGEQFRQNLTTFMEGRLPAAAVVTITNPNVGQTICGTAAAMQIHIECLRLDQSPPDLVELIYNGGQDMIINPAYNETPPLNPPVSQGNYGYHLLGRQDNNTYPINPPANRVNCTNVANRGWETNDRGATFEIWGQDVAGGVTPTPRGTPVQEITSDGPPTSGGRPSTIWQTFQAPASGNFIIRVVHGARDVGETHKITLDNGDTDDAQNGTLINDVTTPARVYGNPWTTFNQTIPLNGGSTYTLALSTTNPVGINRGGLFTDMRAYIDRPDQRATATTNDDTCQVTVDETTTVCTDELWQPQCTAGAITGWTNVQTGASLTNSAFWGQAPAPVPGACPATASGGNGGSVAANLVHTYTVCAVVGGVQTNLQRVVISDASGGVLADSFIGPDGGPVATPTAYSIGSCTDTAFVNDEVLCDVTPFGTTAFLRKYVQTISATNQGQVTSHQDFSLDGAEAYTVQGTVVDCTEAIADRETVCFTYTATGGQVHTGTIKHVDGINAQGWQLFDQNQNLVNNAEPGLTFVSCSPDPFSTTGLCLPDGTPLAVVTSWHHTTGTYADDGWINLRTGAFTSGNPPVGVVACGSSQSVQVSGVFCDVTVSGGTTTVNALVLIEYHYAADGTISSTRIVNATDGTTHTIVGTITTCPDATPAPDRDITVLCDSNAGTTTPFVRDYIRDSAGAIVGTNDRTLAGAPYTVVGQVANCADRDSEVLILCDVNGATSTQFVRRYLFNTEGNTVNVANSTLAGAPYTPTGTVGVCAQTVQSDTDFVEEVMSDSNGTCFIRLFRFNSVTGALISTTNTTLAGAAFTPVGTVTAGCPSCCPVVVAEGCTNTGSGRYVATRAANGTITLQDAITGAAVTQAQIIACPADATQTLTAQGRLVGDADAAWTPGADVAGTLTSVTATVLSGTATITDANGTVMTGLPAGYTATWTAADRNTLNGPQSIDAIGGQTAVVWTQR